MHTIGIDLGGTRIKAVAIDDNGNVLYEHYQSTQDRDCSIWKNAVSAAVNQLKKNLNTEKIKIGLSAPGLPNDDNTAIAYMPGRMQGLENFTWSHFLREPTLVLNDAVAAMMGEAKFGAAKNKKNVVMLTLGTGVGGAILIDGKPYQGAFNKAGHIGHMIIDQEGDCDVTGMPGSLEECIGNCTVGKRSKGKFASTQELIQAYASGDQYAKEVWLKSVKQLALGLASLVNIISPELIVLGGGIARADDHLFLPLREFMNIFEWQPGGNRTAIVKAVYGDMAGAVGAACFAMNSVSGPDSTPK